MTIAVVVDPGTVGNGDFTFAKKMGDWLRASYPGQDLVMVTREGEAVTRAKAAGFDGFISHTEFKARHGEGKIDIDLVVEGPNYGAHTPEHSTDELDLVAELGLPAEPRTPVVMLSEYSFTRCSTPREAKAFPELLMQTYDTGFAEHEVGVVSSTVAGEIKEEEKSSGAGFVYCHVPDDFNRYIKLHKSIQPTENCFSIGGVSLGLATDYAKAHKGISVIDMSGSITVDSTAEDVKRYLAELPACDGYRILCFDKVNADVMRYFQLVSGDFVCGTGDQSMVELMQQKKLIAYSAMMHKLEFRGGYVAQMKRRLSDQALELFALMNPTLIDNGSTYYLKSNGKERYGVPVANRADRARFKLLMQQPALVEEIKRVQCELLAEKNLFTNLKPVLDIRLLPARVKQQLQDKPIATVQLAISGFLHKLNELVPKSRKSIALFAAKHRGPVDRFITKVNAMTESGKGDLPAYFYDQLRELTNHLLDDNPGRTLHALLQAAGQHLLTAEVDRLETAVVRGGAGR